MRTFGTSHVRFSARASLRARAAGLILICLAPLASHAASISVTAPDDSGAGNTCTLRQAIASMNAGSVAGTGCVNGGAAFGSNDTITFSTTTFPVGGANPLVLFDQPGGSLLIQKAPLAIDASANGQVTIQRPAGAQTNFEIIRSTSGGALTLSNLTLRNGFRGGIRNVIPGAALTMINCTVIGSQGGPGILTWGPLTLTNSTVSGNTWTSGGGIESDGGVMTLTNSTVTGNAAFYGGGIYSRNLVTLRNSTVTANTAQISEAGIYSPEPVLATNSIVAGNENLQGGGTDTNLPAAPGSSGNLFNSGNPQLRGLASNGGPTRTMLPLPGSPALDAVACTNAPATDQRGIARPQILQCDIGAVEATVTDATSPPSITKTFGAPTIPLNGNTSLTFSIVNPNIAGSPTGATLTGIQFTDPLPSGLVVATPNALTSTCGGTLTATPASTSVSLTGATLAAGASCTISVAVNATTAGVKNNSVQVRSFNGGNSGVGNTSNAALTVGFVPPSIASAFSATQAPLNTPTSLTFTLTNPNPFTSLTGVGLTDTLPAGLVVATPNALVNSCGGTATATAGSGSATLSGATMAGGASCTMTLKVIGTSPGHKFNFVTVSSTNGGIGNTSQANLDITQLPPTIGKAFGASTIPLNGTTSMTFSITNPNPADATSLYVEDSMPLGMRVATPNAAVNGCGGTLHAEAGGTSVQLFSGELAPAASCSITVNVTGTTPGPKNNSVFVANQGGRSDPATASLTVVAPPAIVKAFGAPRIELGQKTSLTFTVTNPNASLASTGVAFTDNLPAGLVVATPNALTSNCGGIVTAVAGASSASLSGATLAAGASCTIAIDVAGTTRGVKINSVQASSSNGGMGEVSQATLQVSPAPPVITKSFGGATMELGGSTSLTFTIANPNTSVAISAIGFIDNLPAGMLLATPSAVSNTCGGTVTAVAGTSLAQLAGGTLAGGASCTFAVNVTSTTHGPKNNSVQVSFEDGIGNTSNATITVIAPPAITKVFGAAAIAFNESTSLTFTLANPNATLPLAGVAFTDNLPAGMVIATPNGLTSTCGGAATAIAGSASASLSGATLAAGASCAIVVNVTGTTPGTKTNSVQVSSTGRIGNTSVATLTVGPAPLPPQVVKTFDRFTTNLDGNAGLFLAITNPNPTTAMTGIGFTDSLPAGMVVATPLAMINDCGGTATVVPGATSVSLSGSALVGGATCRFGVLVTGTTPGVKTNTVQVHSLEFGVGNTSTATLTVRPPLPPGLNLSVQQFVTGNLPSGQPAFYVYFELANQAAMVTSQIDVTLSAALDAANATLECSPFGITCSAVGQHVLRDTATLPTNTSGLWLLVAPFSQVGDPHLRVDISATGATPGSISVPPLPPAITKVFGAPSIPLEGQTSLTFTLINANTYWTLTSVAFTDTLPEGMAVATPSGLTSTCGGIATAVAGASSASLADAVLDPGASCTLSVNVTGTTPGTKNNSVQVSSTEGGIGNTSNATLSVTPAGPTPRIFQHGFEAQ